MNNCVERDIQEMLPDLLHGSLDAGARKRVEAHLAECEGCTEELGVLRTVATAVVFAPAIDVDRIVRQIPPYTMPTPAVEKPAPSRITAWLVAASLLVVAASGGSLLMGHRVNAGKQVALKPPVQYAPAPASRPDAPAVAMVASPSTSPASARPAHDLALAAGMDGLSDGDLRQLMDDMDSFDALPAAEPEPVISVDGSDNLDAGY
jgi:hypothetical protein